MAKKAQRPLVLSGKLLSQFEAQRVESEERARKAFDRGIEQEKQEVARKNSDARLALPPRLPPLAATRKALQRLGVEMHQLDESIFSLSRLSEIKKWMGDSSLDRYGEALALVVQTLKRAIRDCGDDADLSDVSEGLDKQFKALRKLHAGFVKSKTLKHASFQAWCYDTMHLVNPAPLALGLVPPWRWHEEWRVHDWCHDKHPEKKERTSPDPVRALENRYGDLVHECRLLRKSWEKAAGYWEESEWPPELWRYPRDSAGEQPWDDEGETTSDFDRFRDFELFRGTWSRSLHRDKTDAYFGVVVDVEYWRLAIARVRDAIGPADRFVEGTSKVGQERWSFEARRELNALEGQVPNRMEGSVPVKIHGTLEAFNKSANAVYARMHDLRVVADQREAEIGEQVAHESRDGRARGQTQVWVRADDASKRSGLSADAIRKRAEREGWSIQKSGRLNCYRLENLKTAWPNKDFEADRSGK